VTAIIAKAILVPMITFLVPQIVQKYSYPFWVVNVVLDSDQVPQLLYDNL
jgi:hypothetical protein